MHRWTAADISTARQILGRYSVDQYAAALTEISSALGRPVTGDALQKVFKRRGLGPPSGQVSALDAVDAAVDGTVEALLRVTRRRPVHLLDLCDELGVGSQECRATLDAAQAAGYAVRVTDGYVSCRVPIGATTAPVVVGESTPGRHRVAIATDIHFGSSYCDRAGLRRFLGRARDRGVCAVVVTGDVLDGNKPFLLYEQDHVGFDRQAEDAVRTLADVADGLTFVAIDGNHDGYYSASTGLASGQVLESRMRDAGIDWHFAGVCLGEAEIHGARWQLWHPHGAASTPNAVRRVLNERAEVLARQQPDTLPRVLTVGHFHKHVSFTAFPENVFCVAGGCWQRKGSEFSNRISREWHVGGTLVSYTVDAVGRASEFAAEWEPSL